MPWEIDMVTRGLVGEFSEGLFSVLFDRTEGEVGRRLVGTYQRAH